MSATDIPAGSGNWTGQDWALYCNANPSNDFCLENIKSYYDYRLNIAANATFLGFFALFILAYTGIYIVTRRGLSFTVAMLLGIICELIGYVGRVGSWQNQWSENYFLVQICTLTIGPAFLAAGIYLCLRRIVYVFGPGNSRIPPEYYTRIFIPCDVVSLLLQAIGGGMASVASHENKSVETGDNIMIAGLAFQVFTLLVFIAVAADFALNTLRRHRALGAAALDQDPVFVRVRGSWAFRGFLAALAVATLTIFWRCVFRVAELSRGWNGPLMKRQDLFIGFEGVMIVVACAVLCIFHPALCFRELLEGRGGLGSGRKAKLQGVYEEGKSGSESEAVKSVV